MRAQSLEPESEDEEDDRPTVSLKETMELCARLEALCIFSPVDSGYDLARTIRQFRGKLSREGMKRSRQRELPDMWNRSITEINA